MKSRSYEISEVNFDIFIGNLLNHAVVVLKLCFEVQGYFTSKVPKSNHNQIVIKFRMLIKSQAQYRVRPCLVKIVTMANQVDLDHKFFISLALKNEIAWSALKFIIVGLTPTLEKSKEVNRFLLDEIEKFHVKFQSLEKLQPRNNDKVTESEACFINSSNNLTI